jgi:hypothetical protein
MLRKLKLFYYQWRLALAYHRLLDLTDGLSCGVKLAKYICPEIDKADKEVDRLFAKCKELEKDKS